MKTYPKLLAAAAVLFPVLSVAQEAKLSVKYRYQEATTQARVQGDSSLTFETKNNFRSDARIQKTLFMVRLGTQLQNSLEAFEKACSIQVPEPKGELSQRILPPVPFPQPNPSCEKERIAVAQDLLQKIGKFNLELRAQAMLHSDAKVVEMIDLARKLAKNMKEGKEPIFWGGPVRGGGMMKMELAMASPGGLNVTSGGAQDFGFFRKLIEDGYVPERSALQMEGFLSEFDLSLSNNACDKLVCVQPAVSVDSEKSKLFVQLAMNSNVTPETFKRKPLNLSLVLDISGSMHANDNTEKSRLEWAKDAVIHAINELNEDDHLSIVVFDTQSEVLVPSAPVTDKKALIQQVQALQTRGSTNLEAGLMDGYNEVSQKIDELDGYESRVILISDAGLNTGVVDQATLLKTITNYAQEDIGLTAIGLGLNFNQELVHAISQSHGGNYLYVHSGKDMFRFFENFNFLVTPVAYSFKVALGIEGVDAELVKAYGIPVSEGETAKPVLDIQTLFFSHSGGALLLEYDLIKK